MTEIGTILEGKYEILKKIGQGGMSVVYLAIDNRLNKQWAVKEILYKEKEKIDIFLKGLEIEANILKKLDHPVLPRIVDIIHYEENIYVIMDFIEGRTLTDILKEEGAQPQELVIEWAKQLADALDYLHSLDPPVIYRDMKPSNIMLKPEGTIKLIDFGTAKEFNQENIADTIALGTKGYAAPEQFGDASGRGIHNTDARTDIYSLGATLYHLVTGNNPSEPPYEMRPIREWNKELSKGLEKIIETCIQPNPENRFQSCAGLIYALEHYDELDEVHKRNSIKKVAIFVLSAFMMIGCIMLTIMGYQGKERVLIQEYKNAISLADSYHTSGKDEAALSEFRRAVEEIDRTKAEAYLGMLDLYIKMDETEKGLADIGWYIDQSYKDTKPDETVIFRVAKTYFDNLQDYKKSIKYFSLLEDNEEAEYYVALANILSSTSFSLEESSLELEKFERYNDTLVASEIKLSNYNSLANVYTIYIDQVPNAWDKVIEIAEKALYLLESGEYEVTDTYYCQFYNYLTIAYEKKAMQSEEEEKTKELYQKEIEYCKLTIRYTNEELSTDIAIKKEKMISMAKAYVKIGDIKSAKEICAQGEEELKDQAQKIYLTHMQILCDEQEQKNPDKRKWDLTEISLLYQKAIEEIPSINEDINWRKMIEDFGLENGQ